MRDLQLRLTRDLNELKRRELIIRDGSKFRANYGIIRAFLPAVARVDE